MTYIIFVLGSSSVNFLTFVCHMQAKNFQELEVLFGSKRHK